MTIQEIFAANKNLWNKRTSIHKDSSFYDLPGFKSGKNVLTQIELAEVGDVRDRTMLHLQCHFGMDSLNWARLGAKVTGVDISEESINEANKLKDELGIEADFICCNVYDLKEHLKGQFDIVFTSYGVIGWLPDLEEWANIIAYYLKPGGKFYMAEFHPMMWMFDDDFVRIAYSYANEGLIVTETPGTYVGSDYQIEGFEYTWNHSLSEVLKALLGKGFRLKYFNEYMYSPYPCFKKAVSVGEGKWQIESLEGKIPLVFSVEFEKL